MDVQVTPKARRGSKYPEDSIPVTVTAVEGQGQTGTLGTQPRGRKRCLDVRGGRVRFCDHGSEKEGKTVGDNAGEGPGVVSGVTGLQ
jgi:hypothetical protein